MILRSRRLFLGSLLILIASTVYTFIMYPKLPAQVPVHWGINGQADRFMPKEQGAFVSLWIMLGLVVLFLVLPAISPKAKSIETFRDTYDTIAFTTIGLVGYIHVIALQGSVGTIKVGNAIVLGILVMFGLLGNVLGRVKPNYFVGIRTPWTLENPKVWELTHRLAARLSVAASILGVILLFAGVQPMVCVFISVGALIFPAIYSYFIYRSLSPI